MNLNKSYEHVRIQSRNILATGADKEEQDADLAKYEPRRETRSHIVINISKLFSDLKGKKEIAS